MLMHSAPCTNTSSSIGLSLAAARSSARLISRAKIAREKPKARQLANARRAVHAHLGRGVQRRPGT